MSMDMMIANAANGEWCHICFSNDCVHIRSMKQQQAAQMQAMGLTGFNSQLLVRNFETLTIINPASQRKQKLKLLLIRK